VFGCRYFQLILIRLISLHFDITKERKGSTSPAGIGLFVSQATRVFEVRDVAAVVDRGECHVSARVDVDL